MKKTLSLVFVVAMAAGCSNSDRRDAEAGKVRRELFVECMELAAKMPRQSDDDVADIVESCQTQSYYMSYAVTRT